MSRARSSHLVLLLAAVGLLVGWRAAAAPSESADVVRVSTSHHPSSALRASERPLRSRSEAGPRALSAGDRVHLSLQLDIQSGWHINAHQPTSDALIATDVAFDPNPFLSVEPAQYPAPVRHRLDVLNETLDVYQGAVTLSADATISPQASAGQTIKLTGSLTVQACSDDACLRPSTIPITLPLHLGMPEAVPPTTLGWMPFAWWNDLMSRQSWGVWLLATFLGGLALNLTPCVYPMIPVTVAFFSAQAAGRLGAALGLSLAYVLGMAVTYAALGFLAAQTGALFGSWLQQPLVLIGMAAVMVVLALSLFGAYELQAPHWVTRRFGAARSGHAGAFLMGLVVGFIATPCIGPFVVGLLVFVSQLANPWQGFWLFFVMGLGMGLPFVVIGTLSNRAAALPKAGAWLVWTKRALGVILCGMALYIVRPLVPSAVFGWLSSPSRFSEPSSVIRWQPYTSARLAQAARDGKPVLIDVYADWCVPCVELDRVTFRHPQIVERLNASFVALRVDATGTLSHDGKELVDRYEVYGVPTVLVFDAQGRERTNLRIAGFVPPEELLKALDQAEGS